MNPRGVSLRRGLDADVGEFSHLVELLNCLLDQRPGKDVAGFHWQERVVVRPLDTRIGLILDALDDFAEQSGLGRGGVAGRRTLSRQHNRQAMEEDHSDLRQPHGRNHTDQTSDFRPQESVSGLKSEV